MRNDPVTPEALALPAAWRAEYRSVVGSTNALAREFGHAGAPEGLVVIADEQTAGRGRRGRQWQSPPGAGIWMSLLLRPPLAPRQAARLTLTAAVAVCVTVRDLGLPAGIKWPNDVLVRQRKCCGILMETEAGFLVLGIGLNTGPKAVAFPPPGATSLAVELGRPVARAPLVRAILAAFAPRYALSLHDAGFGRVLDEWRLCSVTLGRRVTVLPREGEAWEGVALEVAADGALVVEREGGRLERVLAGDVSIRG